MSEPKLIPCIQDDKYCTALLECDICSNISESYIDFQNVLSVKAPPGVYVNSRGQIHRTIVCCAFCGRYCMVNIEQK
jgi:hypothetical protein